MEEALRGATDRAAPQRLDFEHALADAVDPAIASAEIASELRRGADYVRVTLALTVVSADVADALVIAWDAFCGAARDDLTGWEVAAAAAEVQPEPPLRAPGADPEAGRSVVRVVTIGRRAVDSLPRRRDRQALPAGRKG